MMEIRPITLDDAAAFLEMLTRLDHETRNMLLEPGERSPALDETRARLQRTLDQQNATLLVAEDRGRLVGYVAISGGQYRRNRHVGYIVIGILQSHTGQGLGTRLFIAMEDWARSVGLHRLELTVRTDNAAGVALYRKMGFAIEGTRQDSLRVDGVYVSEYAMAKLI